MPKGNKNAIKSSKRLNIGLRLPEHVIKKADERAKQLDLNRTDIVETLCCYLSITFDDACINQCELGKLTTLVQNLIHTNNLKTEV